MAIAYEMYDDGTTKEVKFARNELSDDGVYCIVDDNSKSIFLWKGRNADVRRKFVGAQAASRIRSQHGNGYRVHPIDAGEEPSNFWESFD